MGVLDFILKAAINAAPQQPGFQAQSLYIVFNLISPLILGVVLAWVTKLVEKGMYHLLGNKQ